MYQAQTNQLTMPEINLPGTANIWQYLPRLADYLPLDKLPWLVFIIAMIIFAVVSVILVHHWRAYGQGMLTFLSAAIAYFVGAGALIWAAFLLLSLYSLR